VRPTRNNKRSFAQQAELWKCEAGRETLFRLLGCLNQVQGASSTCETSCALINPPTHLKRPPRKWEIKFSNRAKLACSIRVALSHLRTPLLTRDGLHGQSE